MKEEKEIEVLGISPKTRKNLNKRKRRKVKHQLKEILKNDAYYDETENYENLMEE